MKKFLKTCALFVLPIVPLAILGEFLVRQVPNPYKYKYEWMQKNAEDVEILVLGSSHTFYGIRPEFLEGKAFSLANVSQGPEQDLFLFDYWNNRYKHLKTVILPISYFTLFSQGLDKGKEWYRCRYYKIYMDCDLYSDWKPYYNFELSHFVTFSEKLKKFFRRGSELGYDEYGWGNTYKFSDKNKVTWNDGTEAKAAVKRHTVKSWDYIEMNYGRVKDIAEFCKKHSVQLVLITTPCWHSYYDNLNKEQLSKMYELTCKFQKEFKIPYFDYLKDPRFEADDFQDSNHLSDVGAMKFTKILDKDIKNFKK